jgi:hypothetical protein
MTGKKPNLWNPPHGPVSVVAKSTKKNSPPAGSATKKDSKRKQRGKSISTYS